MRTLILLASILVFQAQAKQSESYHRDHFAQQVGGQTEVTAGDETTTHELAAVRAEGETTSAKFDSDKVFFEEMEHEGAEGKLRVTLGGEPHSATFKHSHDHDHGHDHGD